MPLKTECKNDHPLYQSWTGTIGCREDGCSEEMPDPKAEIIPLHGNKATCRNGHRRWLGWRRKGCLEEGCKHRMPKQKN